MTDIIRGFIGLKIRIQVKVDLSSATNIKITWNDPDGGAGQWDGIYELEDSKHYVYYITDSATDLDVLGKWNFQVTADSGSNRLKGLATKENSEEFKVVDPLPTTAT